MYRADNELVQPTDCVNRHNMISRTDKQAQKPAAVAWLIRNLFSSWFNTALTLIAVLFVYLVFVPAVDWLIVDAQWVGNTPEACPNKTAACWPFI